MKHLPLMVISAGTGFLLTFSGGSLIGTAAPKRRPAVKARPVARDYSCLKSRLAFSPISGPAGPLMLLRYDPSVIGTIAFWKNWLAGNCR